MSNEIDYSEYGSLNFLSSGQRKLFKKLIEVEECKAILKSEALKNGENYFASASSLTGIVEKGATIEKFLTDALTLTRGLFNNELYESGDGTADMRGLVQGVCNNVLTAIKNLNQNSTEDKMKLFANNLNNCFPIKVGSSASDEIKKMVTYGIFAGTYKKVIAMMKNYNPNSRTKTVTKKKRAGLGKVDTDTSDLVDPQLTVIAKTRTDKSKDSRWIYSHLNTSLPVCCIDKIICILNDLREVHNLMYPHVAVIDKLNDVIGGGVLSYFSYIAFYHNYNGNTLELSRRLRLKIEKGAKGWKIKSILYPERLNIDNEIKRASKSLTDGSTRAYDVYFIIGGKVQKATSETGSTSANNYFGYAKIETKPNQTKPNNS